MNLRTLTALSLLALPALLRAQTTAPSPFAEAAEEIKDETSPLLLSPSSAPLDAPTGKYLAAHRNTVALLKQAAAVRAPIEPSTFDTLKRCVLLLRLDARYAASQGHSADAAEDLLATMTLARQAASARTMDARIVEVGNEISAIQTLAELLPSFPADLVKALPGRLASLPVDPPFADAIRSVYDTDRARTVAAAKEQPAAVDMVALFEAAKPFYDNIAPDADKSPADFKAAITRESAKLRLNPFPMAASASLVRYRLILAGLQAHRDLLSTALSVLSGDADAVKNSKDPFSKDGAAPFTYAKTESGFTLSSQLILSGKEPVTLKVGP